LLQCMLNYPEIEMQEPFLLDYGYLSAAQSRDPQLIQKIEQDSEHFNWLLVAPQLRLVAHRKEPGDNPKICIPDELLSKFIQFYHLALAHAGMNKVNQTMTTHFWSSNLMKQIKQYIQNCEICQKSKLPGKSYGHLAPRQAQLVPWQEIAVDLIGPWEMEMNDYTLSFRALTIIDTVTNFCEIVRITNKQSAYIGQMLENTWLSRYPRPMHCIFDQGGEFTGAGFQQVLHRHGIEPHPTSVKNPQANAICERLHQTVANGLRALAHHNPPGDMNAATLLVDTAISSASYAVRAAVHQTMKISPGALVFHRDMFLNIPVIADLHLLLQNRQALIDKQLLEANTKRISFDYQPGQQVLKLIANPNKLAPQFEGPFPIITVHTNGTVKLQITPVIQERINIRRIRPFYHLP